MSRRYIVDENLEEYTKTRVQFASDVIVRSLNEIVKNLENQLQRERKEYQDMYMILKRSNDEANNMVTVLREDVVFLHNEFQMLKLEHELLLFKYSKMTGDNGDLVFNE
jgi:uncharacterized protein (DUF1697 family)